MSTIRLGVVPAAAALFMLMPCSASNQSGSGHENRTDRASGGGSGAQESDWLRGDVDARFGLVAKHLRGLDMAIVEVGYRYTELYWASRDRNWEYAAYQLGKIETAVANGVGRRPKRAVSARMLDVAVSRVREAIEGRDAPALDAAMESLTATCRACHQIERVPFIQVVPPAVRLSPVRPDSATEPRQGQSIP